MALFNYIYKNKTLIQSLYAQIFSGLLQSVESHEKVAHTGITSAEAGIPTLAKGTLTGNNTEEKIYKSVVSPHDAALYDILVKLSPKMKNTLEDVDFSDIVHLSGNLIIIPRDIEKNGLEALYNTCFKNFLPANLSKEVRQQTARFMEKTLLSQQEEGVHFFFKVSTGQILRGVLEPSFLEESQMALTFKHGFHPIPTEIVALYEGSVDNDSGLPLPNESLLGGLYDLSRRMSNLYLAGLPDTIPVTPITLCYRLNNTEDLPEQAEE